MEFREQTIPGLCLLKPELNQDERGILRRHFCQRELEAHGLVGTVRQGNVSENPRRGTLRGFHYQLPPNGEAKTISCLTGAIHDVVVDLRPGSPTYLRWAAFELDATNRLSLHVPVGCANAFLTRADGTLVHYYHSEFFAPDSYRGFRWDDPLFAIAWPFEPSVISERDRSYPDFRPEPPP